MEPIIETKITVIGNGKTGKTSMLNLLKDKKFSSVYTPTTFDILTVDKKYKTRNMQINFWDTAGQEEFERLAPLHLPNTDLIMLCFSCSDPNSFDPLASKWKVMMDYYCAGTPFVLVGCMTDKRHDGSAIKNLAEMNQAMITKEKGRHMGVLLGALEYLECSAKDNVGGDEIMEFLCKWIYKQNGGVECEKTSGGFFRSLMSFCGCGR